MLASRLLACFATATSLFAQSRDSALVNRSLSDSALVAVARHDTDSLRSALVAERGDVARATSDDARRSDLTFARRLATSYQRAWDDSFFVREIERFGREPRAWQLQWVHADSLRRAGISAAAQVGVPAALRFWRRSVIAFAALHDTAGRSAATGSVGAGYYLAGDLDSAQLYLNRALALAVRARDLRTEANAIGTLASVHKDLGDLKEARTLYERALGIRARCGDDRGAAADQNNLGLISQTLGDLNAARGAFRAALAANQRGDRRHSIAVNLTNLANLASVTGESQAADSLYTAALAIHIALGERDDEAIVLHNIALLQMRRADLDGALASLTRALQLTDSTGADREHLDELADLASLQAARGDVQGGLRTLRSAAESASSSHAAESVRARLALARADLSAALNDRADAERQYASAEKLATVARDRSLLAEAQRGEGMLLTERQRYAAALPVLLSSERNHRLAGDVRGAAASRLMIGYAQAMMGDTARARQSLSLSRSELHDVHDPAAEASAWSALGDLELASGSLLQAELDFRRGIKVVGSLLAPSVNWPLHAGLGSVLKQRGALSEASSELRIAIAHIEQTAIGLSVQEQREAFHADKWDVYALLATTELQRGNLGDAFAVSERMRAQQALALLLRGTVSYRSPADSLIAREQALRHQISELTNLVEAGPSPANSLRGAAAEEASRDAVRDALAIAERRYAETRTEMHATGSRRGSAIATVPTSWRDVAAALRGDEVMLEYLIADSASTVFVITRDTIAAISLDVRRPELAALVDYSRDAIGRPAESASAPWRAPLRRLYQLIMQPVADGGFLRDRRHLIIVPHAELHFVPFAALLRTDGGDHFLVESATIAMAPSASMWLELSRRTSHAGTGQILAMAPRTSVLPASRSEVDSIGEIFGARTTVLHDGNATRSALLSRAPHDDIIHIASLGVLNKHNPLFSFIELAPVQGDDGRLAVTDIYDLHLDAQLVVLSACQTALGSGAIADVPTGDEWVGFTSAFLNAGAHDVLATLWPVEDGATAQFMSDVYRSLAGRQSAEDALAQAQRRAIRTPSRSEPFRWAGFTLTGGR